MALIGVSRFSSIGLPPKIFFAVSPSCLRLFVFGIGLTTSGVEIGLSCSLWLYTIILVPIYQDGIMHKYISADICILYICTNAS